MWLSVLRERVFSPHLARRMAQAFSPHMARLFSPRVRLLTTGVWIAAFPPLTAQAQVVEFAPDPVAAPAEGPRAIKIIEIKGSIGPGLVSRLRGAMQSADAERFPAGVLLILDSPGGDGLAGMELGRMARAAKAHTFVRGRCASACVFILAGGVVRGVALDRAVAIHRPRLTTFVKGLGVVDINSATNPNAAAALEVGNRQSRAFLHEMGMPDTLFKAMMAAPTDQVRYLNLAELADLGLIGFDPEYRASRAPTGAAQFKIAEDEFVRRTLRVAEVCLGEKATSREIVRCYRRVLRTGE